MYDETAAVASPIACKSSCSSTQSSGKRSRGEGVSDTVAVAEHILAWVAKDKA